VPERIGASISEIEKENTMALKAFGAFAAGVVVGWTGRSVFGSTRELMVQALVAAHQLQVQAKRLIAERFEWAEDMFAEGRARYEAEVGQGGPLPHDAPIGQGDAPVARGRAA
jgi:hypothetical protein